jgi:hypothetical protein
VFDKELAVIRPGQRVGDDALQRFLRYVEGIDQVGNGRVVGGHEIILCWDDI